MKLGLLLFQILTAYENGTVFERGPGPDRSGRFKRSRGPWFNQDAVQRLGRIGFKEFTREFKHLDVGIGQSAEEQFRVYARDCFNFGSCRKANRTSGLGDCKL